MTESTKVTQEAEVLSQLLDELNAGQQPKSDDPEAAELLAIAALIKNAGPIVRPPQHLLDQTVDQILADQPAKPIKQPKKFWSWLNPGVLGAAASILLVIGFNLSPSWNSSEVQTVSAPATAVERREMAPIVQPAVSEDQKQTIITEKTNSAVQESASVPDAAVTVSPLPNVANSSTNLTVASSSPEAAKKAPAVREQAPVTAEKAAILSEQSVVTEKNGTMYKAAARVVDEPSDRWPLPILSLPGQTPDEISSDKKTGVIRQVFWKGTPQEVIITQRRVRLEESAAQTAPIGTVNSVTMILHSQEVTIEGRQTEQELMKIAKQLKSP